MIMILGSTHDDVLYFESVMTKKRTERVFDRFPIVIGKLFNQDVILVSEIYTNYLSNAIILYLIQKYFILLVFNVGTCISYSKDVGFGEIAISEQVIFSDLDQVGNRPVKLGQIPGFPQYFKTDKGVMEFVNRALSSRTFDRHFNATYLSSNTYYTKKEQIEPLLIQEHLLPVEKSLVFDSTYGGVALACHLSNISCIALKIVETSFGVKMDYIDYSKVLENYSTVGKIIVSSIGDIGRTDILEDRK